MKLYRGMFLILRVACVPATTTEMQASTSASKTASLPVSPLLKSQLNTMTPKPDFLVLTPYETVKTVLEAIEPAELVNTLSYGTDKIGDAFQIIVESKPTIGYFYEIEQNKEKYIQLTGEPINKPANNKICSGGNYSYKFRVIKTGKPVLQMIYLRPWEKGVPFSRLKEINAQIQ
jgi:predicted secreted protein